MNLHYFLIFGIGLASGFSHCLGMCGPLVGGYTLRISPSLRHHLAYNLGRVVTYTFLGAILGLAGSLGELSAEMAGFRGMVPILGGILIILMSASVLSTRSLPSLPLEKWAGKLMRKRTLPMLAFGLLMGFLPCGILVPMEVKAASARDMARGALTMLTFGLGTVPSLLLLGTTTARVTGGQRRRITRLAALLMLLLGIMTLYDGIASFTAP